MSTNENTRQLGAPGLAPRMRKSAAILTRAACLLAGDGRLHGSGTAARNLTMSGLIRRVRDELFPDQLAVARKAQWIRKELVIGDAQRRWPKKRLRAEGTDEASWAFAYALIPQDPMDKTPEVGDLVNAAGKLREWAEAEEFMGESDRWELTERATGIVMPTVAELRAAEAEIYGIMGQGWPYQGNVTLSAADDGGVRASILLYFGGEHELASADSLDGLLADVRKRAAKRAQGKEAA